ncbi:hypothetical protein SDC9_210047 [bioreactor metagenome]|uniref:Uncharacterized protein n=1 Tax=bioreactor metagenome TaxID=1076179 RepID=A0A645JGR2_9ZZZZ
MDEVGLVDAQVRQRAEGRTRLVEEPRVLLPRPALRPGVPKRGVEGDHLADLARGHAFSGFHMRLGKPLVVPQHQCAAALLRGGSHGLAIRKGGGHGLFAQHMQALLECLDTDGRVIRVGHAHAHRVHAAIKQRIHAA